MTVPHTTPDPVVALGYTPREADFLRLVARHGGYFVMRQYCAALDRERGSTTAAFARTLLRRKDATISLWPWQGGEHRSQPADD